ncbi:ABC transporter ATP-binding protein [Streptomyces swartbergensis]|uniref:ABC transporter ATP-binding protein n=1 Tax=Streptomyces swartbergensis TaxID=487165 RepID=UPI00381370C5
MEERPQGLAAEGLTLAYDGRHVVDALDVTIPAGRVTAVVGSNACGKSTLLRGLSRLLTPKQGAVYLDGTLIHTLRSKELARRLGMLPQSPVAPDGITVLDLVKRGRSPHQSWWRQWSPEDEEAVHGALEATGLLEQAERSVDELSGGQRQRAWIAMALAQGTPVLLLDEPTNHLDLTHQIEILDLVVDLNREQGRTVVLVLHDLNHACRYADHVIAMKDGRIVAEGAPADVISRELIAEVFGLSCTVIEDPAGGGPHIIPFGRHHGGRVERKQAASASDTASDTAVTAH